MKSILSIVALSVAVGSAIGSSRLERNMYTLSIKTGSVRECSLISCTSLSGPAVVCPNPEVKFKDKDCTEVFTGIARSTSVF